MRKFIVFCLLVLMLPCLGMPDAVAGPQDPKARLAMLKSAAEKGSVHAQSQLGRLYLSGNGVRVDDREAFRWFLKAATQGDAFSQDLLGLMYASGKGVPKDYAESVRWFQKAAKQGYAPSQNTLGHAYAEGKGVPKSRVEAYAWWAAAAQQGNKDAHQNKEILGRDMSAAERAEALRLASEYRLQYARQGQGF